MRPLRLRRTNLVRGRDIVGSDKTARADIWTVSRSGPVYPDRPPGQGNCESIPIGKSQGLGSLLSQIELADNVLRGKEIGRREGCPPD
jgi:hypothetical protein